MKFKIREYPRKEANIREVGGWCGGSDFPRLRTLSGRVFAERLQVAAGVGCRRVAVGGLRHTLKAETKRRIAQIFAEAVPPETRAR